MHPSGGVYYQWIFLCTFKYHKRCRKTPSTAQKKPDTIRLFGFFEEKIKKSDGWVQMKVQITSKWDANGIFTICTCEKICAVCENFCTFCEKSVRTFLLSQPRNREIKENIGTDWKESGRYREIHREFSHKFPPWRGDKRNHNPREKKWPFRAFPRYGFPSKFELNRY